MAPNSNACVPIVGYMIAKNLSRFARNMADSSQAINGLLGWRCADEVN